MRLLLVGLALLLPGCAANCDLWNCYSRDGRPLIEPAPYIPPAPVAAPDYGPRRSVTCMHMGYITRCH